MKRAVLSTFISVAITIILLMFQRASAEAYRHSETGIVFPDRVAILEKRAEVTSYEAKHPGLGISVGYDASGMTVTVYVYKMGMKSIPTNLNSLVLKNQFKQAASDIVSLGELGYYSNVKKISDGEVSWGAAGADKRSLHAFYSYSQKGQDRLSHLYLMGFRNHFFKVRFTYDKEVEKPAEKVQKKFLKEFSRILGSLGKVTNK